MERPGICIILHNFKKHIIKWFTLDGRYNKKTKESSMTEYIEMLERDNINRIKEYCKICYVILAVMGIVRCLSKGITSYNIVPYDVAFLCIFLIHIAGNKLYNKVKLATLSYLLTALFSIVWYALSMYMDILVDSDKPGMFSCVVFMSMALIFNKRPVDNFIETLLAYIVMIVLEISYVPNEIMLTDSITVAIAIVIGVAINQKSTKINIREKLYIDMYKSATRASIIVALIDMENDKIEVLQCPDYMEEFYKKDMMAAESIIGVRDNFVAEEYKKEFDGLLNFDNIQNAIRDVGDKVIRYFVDFRKRWCQLTIVEHRRHHGILTSVVAIVSDVDEEKRREFEYQKHLHDAVRDAELANAAKTNFLRRMSHDIRTPINGIRGMLEIAEHYEDNPEKQKECRKKMWESSGYLLSLVNNVLDMNKLESGTITLREDKFDLMELLNEANTIAKIQAQDAGVKYIIDNKPDAISHLKLIGSEVHLKRILQNIAVNAVKYNRPGGTVRVSCVEIPKDDDTSLFRFECADTGIGMSEEFKKHAFEPFAQEGKKSANTYSGTGLGLSITKELTGLMGGSIEFESKENEGSTFWITIPLKINHENEADKINRTDKIDVKGMKALLVEDNDLNAEITTFHMENIGFKVKRAVNGLEAVNIFKASKEAEYDIIFMDIMMPVMNGLEATETIRGLDRKDAATIPIIAMSANAFSDDIERSHKAGMNAHIMKPLDMNVVKRTILDLLKK